MSSSLQGFDNALNRSAQKPQLFEINGQASIARMAQSKHLTHKDTDRTRLVNATRRSIIMRSRVEQLAHGIWRYRIICKIGNKIVIGCFLAQ